jgi:hypothetical protein
MRKYVGITNNIFLSILYIQLYILYKYKLYNILYKL